MQRDARLAASLLVPLVAATVFSWARLVAELDDVPADADYGAARAILEREGFRRATDALAILPPWSLRPLAVVGDLEPISGDALAAQPLDRFTRLWLLVEPDAEPHHAPLRARFGAPAAQWRAGRVRVERYELPATDVTFDFAARLAEARVALVRGIHPAPLSMEAASQAGAHGDVKPCPPAPGGGFSCGREGWQRVALEWLLVTENAERAVFTHPPERGRRLVITWDNVPLGERLVLRAGFTRDGADRAPASVRVRVLVDAAEVHVAERAPAFLFSTDVVELGARAGTRGSLSLVFETDDPSGAHFAWDAWTARAAVREAPAKEAPAKEAPAPAGGAP